MEKDKIAVLQNFDRLEIRDLYYLHRDAFFNFGKKYKLNHSELSDIYQEAFIAIRKHAIDGHLDSVQSSFKTYLFGIGKFKIFDRLGEKKNRDAFDPLQHRFDSIVPVETNIDKEELTIEQQLLRKYFKTLGKKCRELLTMIFYRGLSAEEIIRQTDYSNESVIRSQKSRCLKTLRDKIGLKTK